ncbi:unnamed protein product [Echinostoma caproni]|uniref:Glyco_transf_7C domain-containing protein n=1 Tax=Echinostoma caproni TaxID=27848 RepID=A0A183B8P1_9TREM|nr:unnamed protein product [Echinostoma caproni]
MAFPIFCPPRLPYSEFVGGVTALSRTQFELVGGFSNMYFGWGGEDDDLLNRIRVRKLWIERPPVTKYKMIRHGRDELNEVNKDNRVLLSTFKDKIMEHDTFLQSKYLVLTAEPRYNGLVYWIEVDIMENDIIPMVVDVYEFNTGVKITVCICHYDALF